MKNLDADVVFTGVARRAFMAAAAPVALLALLLVSGCGGHGPGGDQWDAGSNAEIVNPDCDGDGDDDMDTISNAEEGCFQNRDTDGDGVPDYLDIDSDNDGIRDAIEASWGVEGEGELPVDTDGDGLPNYVDIDSDNDGLLDGDEDLDHNGWVGECVEACDPADPTACTGSGPGSGHCNPLRHVCMYLECLGFETDPLVPDTDGDGISDGDDRSACERDFAHWEQPVGAEVWVMLPRDIGVGWPGLADPDTSATIWEDPSPAQPWAAFAVVRPVRGASALAEALALEADLVLPGVTVTVSEAGGRTGLRQDPSDYHAGHRLRLATSSPTDLGDLRTQLLEAAAGPLSEPAPDPMGTTGTEFILGIFTVRKTADFCDPGSPLRAIHVVTLATEAHYQTEGAAAYWVDDLSYGSGIGWHWQLITERECGVFDATATFDLYHWPIPATLVLMVEQLQGDEHTLVEIPRSPVDGYTYDHLTNQISLTGNAWTPSDLHTVMSYSRWMHHLLPCD